MDNVTPTEALNSLYPLSCFFVISADKSGKPSGMIASWVFQTSFEPQMIAVSVNKANYTHDLITGSKQFVIAAANKGMEKAVLYFGNTSGRDVDKFKATGLKTQKGEAVGLPILSDASINFECKLVNSVETGEHTIFIGEVVAAWRDNNKKVLMYMGKQPGKRLFEEF